MTNRIHIIARNPGLPPSPEQPGPLPPRPEEPVPNPTPNPDLPNLPPAEPEEPRLPPADPDPSPDILPNPQPGWSTHARSRTFLIEGHGIRSSIRIF